MKLRSIAARGFAILLVPIALVCLAVPFQQLFVAEDNGLIDDTRAYFGAGTADDVPRVSQVRCLSQHYGTSRRGLTEWSCTLYLDTSKPQPAGDPFAGMTPEEAFDESMRRTKEQLDALLRQPNFSGKIERVLPTNRAGDIPALRRLSGEDEPPRFGVIWGGGELALRWVAFALLAAFFIGIGLACLWATRAIWRKYR